MNTQAKPVVSIARDSAIIGEFATVTNTATTLSAKMLELAKHLAAQVSHLESLPVSSRVGLIEATYAPEFKTLAADRNAVAQLRACVWAQIANDLLVEVTPPSKDGKTAAVFKPAKDLTPKQAKVHLAVVKNDIAEQEATPEEKARKEAEANKAKAAAQEQANAMATSAAKLKADEAWAYCLADANRATLVTKLADIGYKLAKLPGAPKG